MKLHRLAVRLLVRPYMWAVNQERQTVLTRTIRAAWRAL
jgi:hypothetical protein